MKLILQYRLIIDPYMNISVAKLTPKETVQSICFVQKLKCV